MRGESREDHVGRPVGRDFLELAGVDVDDGVDRVRILEQGADFA